MLSNSDESGHPGLFHMQVYSLPALGLHCCVKTFSLGAQSGDYSLVAGHGFLSAVTADVAEHRL